MTQEAKRAYNREYQRKRRQNPEVRESDAEHARRRYANDEQFRERQKQASRERYAYLKACMAEVERLRQREA